MKKTILLTLLFLLCGIAIGLSINASAQTTPIPSWIKNTAKWWSEDKISEAEYIKSLQWLINNRILVVTNGDSSSNSNSIRMTTNSIEELFPITGKDVSDKWGNWISQVMVTESAFGTTVGPGIYLDNTPGGFENGIKRSFANSFDFYADNVGVTIVKFDTSQNAQKYYDVLTSTVNKKYQTRSLNDQISKYCEAVMVEITYESLPPSYNYVIFCHKNNILFSIEPKILPADEGREAELGEMFTKAILAKIG